MTTRQRLGAPSRGTPRQPPPGPVGPAGPAGPPGPAGTLSSVSINTAPYNVIAPAAGEERFILVDTANVLWPSGGDVILPAVPNANSIVNVKDTGGNAAVKRIDIQGNGLLVEGVATLPLDVNGASWRLFFDGTAWWIT